MHGESAVAWRELSLFAGSLAALLVLMVVWLRLPLLTRPFRGRALGFSSAVAPVALALAILARLAETYGIRLYNAAVLEADGRRVQVLGTDESDVALGILRLLRQRTTTVCFMEGHGEYPFDNFEFHTHVETLQAHTHGDKSSA